MVSKWVPEAYFKVTSTIFDKGDSCYDFLFAFLYTSPPSEKESALKEKNLLQRVANSLLLFAPKASSFFPFRENPFSKGRKKLFWQLSPSGSIANLVAHLTADPGVSSLGLATYPMKD